ncbi:pirin family protein [Sphingomonas alba]|uniref:Pirin family protein n=1 Tax=Sphingomonas alba TaxID=2908208 RepID=A0ABT0RLW7_9SPHN|nr:pirin family protein [Sphingomonas alba]MCL6683641.1 pirin family protein [Sphingomonas alba]
MIEQVVTPVTHDLGAFKVRRALPARERTMVGPFIFVDQFGPAQMVPGEGMDVRPHPHINLATVTYLFDGAIQHKDSLGNDQRIEPGAINLMTAGKGIVHSERSPNDTRRVGPSFYGMQTWLALPDGKEEIDPAFEHVPTEGLPLVEGDGVSARVLMGSLWGATAGTTCHSPTIYADLILDAGASVSIEAEADERAIMVTEGEAALDGEQLEPFALYVIAPGHQSILKASIPTRAMLLGGGAFATPRFVHWNFVSSRRERITEAKNDWIERRFPLVPGDEEEFIPYPPVVKTVSYP